MSLKLHRDSGISLTLGEAMMVYALVGKMNGTARSPSGEGSLWERLKTKLDPDRSIYDRLVYDRSAEKRFMYTDYQEEWEACLLNPKQAQERQEAKALVEKLTEDLEQAIRVLRGLGG